MLYLNKTTRRATSTLLTFLLFHVPGYAQLTADFFPDKPGACVPFNVSFTNTTNGASPAAIYEWNFGNGNRSSLKNASAVFQEERTYTVTLTVKDAGKTSTQTKIITGYKRPTVNFSASLSSGCTPLPVIFTSTSTASEGSITGYFWDFGDGYTQQTGSPQITHVYATAQKPPVILAVTDNHGCSSTKVINDLFQVLPGVTADFSATDSFICFVPDPVQLKDKSSGFLDKLIYSWEFGDGGASTLKDPVHVFNTKGAYTVKLAVENSVGCRDTLIKSSYLNVGNFKSEITSPAFSCKNASVEFKNTSIPTPTSFSWLVDGMYTMNNNYNGIYTYQFTTAGKHTIQLTNNYGNCTEVITKEIEVRALPEPAPFIADVPFHCAGHVRVAFHDTTSGVVQSAWNFERYNYPLPVQATGKDVTYTFTQENSWRVTLFVTDANGCSNSREQEVKIAYPNVRISATDANGMIGCTSLTKQFEINTSDTLTSFSWDFGNGNVSTKPNPEVTFTELYPLVRLNYTTSTGCQGTSNFYGLNVFPKPKAEFVSVSGTTICGNSKVTFETPQVNYWDYWMIDGVYAGTSYYTRMDHQFKDTGLHTVTLVVYNDGCRDTMTKVDYIRVVPSFPKISSATNTCNGDRGTVTFTQASRYAEKWVWDFGDGSPLLSLDTDQTTVSHDYKTSGKYMVRLATIAGSCTVKDSMYVYVQMKRNPVLSSPTTTVCQDQGIAYSLTNVDRLAYDGIWVWAYVDTYEYSDGTTVKNDLYNSWDTWIYMNPYLSSFKPVQKDKTAFRVITLQPYFNCLDTSNFIPIKVADASAGFQITANNVCYKQPVIFNDTSRSYNSNIIARQWSFGDGQTLSTTQGGMVSHIYSSPGEYKVTLKITDDGGCSSTTSLYSQTAIVNGPKAAFSASGTNVQLNTSVQFFNQANTYNSYPAAFSWEFGDGGTSSDINPAHTFTTAGTYQVRMIAKNNSTGCIDTAYEQITVKDFQVAFGYQQSFILNGKCPPVLFQFFNRSTNYTSLKWDFGDGNVSENVTHPSHLYRQPGEYTVSLFVQGYNGLTDVFKEIITIKKPALTLTADILHSCTSESISFNTNNQEGYTYSWDFGDGNIENGTDSFAVHKYPNAGVYLPSLVVRDNSGCASVVSLKDTIVIDSLRISLGDIPESICAPKSVMFTPQIVNVAADEAQQTLSYHWDFGSGNKADTSNVKNPTFYFQQAGKFAVSLNVKSPYGCEKTVHSDILVLQGLGAQISGPGRICEGANAQFSGSTSLPGQPSWKWVFHDGTINSQQNPPPKNYSQPGMFPVKLVVDNGGCLDTLTKTIQVDAKPVIGLPFKEYTLCRGARVDLKVTGGNKYSWSPASGLDNTNTATVIAAPVINTTYKVDAISINGCSSSDSIKILVIQPLEVLVHPVSPICFGNSVTLFASGAHSYQWIQNTTGLNNSAIADPVAKPLVTTTYTVVGKDAHQCFTDTLSIAVDVIPVPTVDAGESIVVMGGTAHQLQPTFSNDVVKWLWTPASYLSCTTCSSPVSTPEASVNYKLTVTNTAGCSASDTLTINLLCSESKVYIPAAFTPNNDGSNDRFAIKGDGIRVVHRFVIYDRYGHTMFERSNFTLQDMGAAWDGIYKGMPVPAGSYVYFAEMSCNEKTFTRKGSVTLIR